MPKIFFRTTRLLILVIFISILIYLPSLGVFFSGDDWFHLRISQVDSIGDFLSFFSFSPNLHTASFYRPIPTQVFFYVFNSLFDLTAWPYHLFVLICFGYLLYLLFIFAKKEFKSNGLSLMTVLLYGLSVSNFTRLYFLSAFQEIAMVIFSLLCLLNFPKTKSKALVFFILALMSKETAVVIPLFLVFFNFQYIRHNLKSLIPYGLVLLIYLCFRLKIFGGAVGDSYLWDFSLEKAANTLMWYVLWSFGAPEILVDYVDSGLKLVPKLFIDYALWWKPMLLLLLGTIISTFLLLTQKLNKIDQKLIKYIAIFIISLLPVLFLPSHKFSLELGLPLLGFTLSCVWLISGQKKVFVYTFFLFYISLNLTMNYLTYIRHYSVSRGQISDKVFNYLSQTYPSYPSKKYFEFINDAENYGKEWGQSKQISQAISGSDLFRVFYRSPDIKVYYQDIEGMRPANSTPIYLSTKQFINP